MQLVRHIKTLLLITLLSLTFSSGVNAKPESGVQNLAAAPHQGETLFNPLMHQEKTDVSTIDMSGYPLGPKGTTTVGQWMSKAEYTKFVKDGVIPRTNVLTKGPEGYIKQADVGDFYVKFDVDASLLVQKNKELGWSLVKSKNQMYKKLAERKGETLADPIGTNIQHNATKFRY